MRVRHGFTGRVAVVALLSLVLTACGSEANGDAATADGDVASANGWMDIRLTDVDGESFTISELAGTPVFVENFATWCSNCLRQLGDTQDAAARAGDNAAFLALSVETDLDPGDVAAYAEENGFDDIRFAVMTPEMLAAVEEAFGPSALNPPATPKVLIDATGTPGELVTGFESPDEIVAQVDRAA